jgi:hypothetical protein
MLAKLKREHERLKAEVTGDDLFNFVVTAYHIIDWIKKNPSLPTTVRDEVEQMYAEAHVAVCRDLANASKHFTLKKDYQGRVTEKTSAISDYGAGRYGKGAYGAGEHAIVIVLIDGKRLDALQFVQTVVDVWEGFFRKHSL